MEYSDKMTILVNSCDAYSDVWDLFFEAFRVQWPECNYKIVLNTETKKYSYKDMPIEVHNYKRIGKDRWGERYKASLKSISTPYIMPFLDDFVLTEPVKKLELIEQIIQFMDERPTVSVVYLAAYPKWCFTLEQSRDLPGFGKMPQVCEYKLSTSVAIWRREKLISLIKDFETPWEWEINASYRASRQYCGAFFAPIEALEDIPRNEMFMFPYGGAIRRGLWNVGMDELARKYGVKIDFEKRGLMDVDNPFNQRERDEYDLKKNFKRNFYKVAYWRHVRNKLVEWRHDIYAKYRFFRSLY